jgi:hypothetical protein
MRKLVTWLLVSLGIGALVRKLRRRRPEPAAETATATLEPSHTLPPQTPTPPVEAAAPPVETAPADTAPAESAPAESTPAEPAAAPDPADELREKLARSRADMPSSEPESVDDRRASVYEQGRAALDEMRPSAEPGGEPTHQEP